LVATPPPRSSSPPRSSRLSLRSSTVFLSEVELERRRRMHRALVELRRTGAVSDAELWSEEGRVVSEFGDPLAAGRANAAKVASYLVAAVRVEESHKGNSSQQWRSGLVAGRSELTFDEAGTVAELRLADVTVGGRPLSAAADARRRIFDALFASPDRYDFVAGAVNRLVGVLPTPLEERDDVVSERVLFDVDAAAPDPSALGEAGFEAYDATQRVAKALVASVLRIFDDDEEEDDDEGLYARDFRGFGLAGEPVAGLDGATLREGLRGLRAARRALAATGAIRDETYAVTPSSLRASTLTVDVAYKANTFDVAFQVAYEISPTRGLATEAALRRLVVGGKQLEPTAAQRRLATLAADFLGRSRGDAARGGAKPPSRRVEASAEDALAVTRLAAALFAGGSLDSDLLAPDVVVRGLLGERLLTGRDDARAALRASLFVFGGGFAPKEGNNNKGDDDDSSFSSLGTRRRRGGKGGPFSLEVERFELTASGRPRALLKATTAGSWLVAVSFAIANGAVQEIAFDSVRSAAGDDVLPARLAAALKTATDLGAATRHLGRALFPSAE